MLAGRSDSGGGERREGIVSCDIAITTNNKSESSNRNTSGNYSHNSRRRGRKINSYNSNNKDNKSDSKNHRNNRNKICSHLAVT